MADLERGARVRYAGKTRNLKGHTGTLGWRNWDDKWHVRWDEPFPTSARYGWRLRTSYIAEKNLRLFRNGNTSHDHWRPAA